MFQNIQFTQEQLEGGGFILVSGLGLRPMPGFHTLLGEVYRMCPDSF